MVVAVSEFALLKAVSMSARAVLKTVSNRSLLLFLVLALLFGRGLDWAGMRGWDGGLGLALGIATKPKLDQIPIPVLFS